MSSSRLDTLSKCESSNPAMGKAKASLFLTLDALGYMHAKTKSRAFQPLITATLTGEATSMGFC